MPDNTFAKQKCVGAKLINDPLIWVGYHQRCYHSKNKKIDDEQLLGASFQKVQKKRGKTNNHR